MGSTQRGLPRETGAPNVIHKPFHANESRLKPFGGVDMDSRRRESKNAYWGVLKACGSNLTNIDYKHGKGTILHHQIYRSPMT